MNLYRKFFLVALSLFAINAHAENKVKYYFNHTVDNSVSAGVNAINLNGLIDDTLIAYINRSKYTLDIAVYDFTSYSSSSLGNVANAINAAYARGVRVRWIYDGNSTNSGLSLLNSAIPTLASPTSSSFGIMHNKFMIVDGYSPNPDESIVWAGSTNWSVQQFTQDYNNIVIFQDSALAHAYIDEFNMMWGDTGTTPNASNSKFGHQKTDLGRHNFIIDGHLVELYFSPSDGTNNHILSSINSANKDMYFGMYTFTYTSDANAIVSAKNNGVYVAGIMDNFSQSYTPYSILNPALGSNMKVYSGSGIYHNKYLIVDPSDACSDPLVLTGSHNWSSSANTDNDENTVIIHDGFAANIFYQSFRADFVSFGGSLNTLTGGCVTAVGEIGDRSSETRVFPNPAKGNATIAYQLNRSQNVSISLISVTGQSYNVLNEWENAGSFERSFAVPASGVYMVRIVTGENVHTYELINE